MGIEASNWSKKEDPISEWDPAYACALSDLRALSPEMLFSKAEMNQFKGHILSDSLFAERFSAICHDRNPKMKELLLELLLPYKDSKSLTGPSFRLRIK